MVQSLAVCKVSAIMAMCQTVSLVTLTPPSLWQGESGTNGRRQYMFVNTPKKLVSFPGSPYKGSGNEVSTTH